MEGEGEGEGGGWRVEGGGWRVEGEGEGESWGVIRSSSSSAKG